MKEKLSNKSTVKGGARLFFLSAILVGIVAGLFLSLVALKVIAENSAIINGAWLHSRYVGSKEADGYIRTVVSIVGFLGMNRGESIYFIARTDDEKNILSGACSYTLTGHFSADQARWWSITAYNAISMKLIPNNYKRYSFNSDTIKKNADGDFTIIFSTQAPPEMETVNWIPLQEEVDFDLILRLYNPSKTTLDNVATASLPKIEKGACT